MKGKTVLLGMAVILGMGVGTSFAGAPPILLTIDDSDVSAVTITATGLAPDANDSGVEARLGVDLLGFFNQDESSLQGDTMPNSTLFGGGLTLSYNSVISDNYSTGGTSGVGSYVDLGLYVDNSNDPQVFSTSQPAFSGSWTFDLSSLGVNSAALPTVGAQGYIMTGFSGEPGSVIGAWQVAAVPEPTTGSLLVLGSAASVLFWRRRGRKNAVVRA